MNFTRTDLTRCQGLISTLNRAKFELEGAMETMALSQVIVWVNSLHKTIENELKEAEEKQQKNIEKALSLLAEKERQEKEKEETSKKEYEAFLEKKSSEEKPQKPLKKSTARR